MNCKSCDKKIRKGLSRRATVWIDGKLEPGFVCTKCFCSAVTVVVPPPVTVPPACAGCKRAPAKYCAGCVERLGGHVRELAAANVARVPV